jgi:uncharacterized protein YqeY
MSLRQTFTDQLKSAMKAGDAARISTLRMILARLKEVDIAARPRGVAQVPDEEVFAMLRAMVKSRRESATLYRQGNRPELAEKEEAEIAIIESFLPQQLSGQALEEAVAAAIAETGATGAKDMGRVMAALKTRHGSNIDLSEASRLVRAKLSG